MGQNLIVKIEFCSFFLCVLFILLSVSADVNLDLRRREPTVEDEPSTSVSVVSYEDRFAF